MIKSYKDYIKDYIKESIKEDKFDIESALVTMIDGDDVEFDGVDFNDSIWNSINFDPEKDDISNFVSNLNPSNTKKVKLILMKNGYLN
jgi:hypothetical protein